MSDNPVKWTAAGLTPAGNALQAALLGTGDGLTFTRAAAADAEGVERLDLTLQSPCTVDGPKCRVPVLLTNSGVETGFTMTELRFYVRRVTDGAPTGEEILYATVTDETGDPIPTAAQSPGFTIDWAFVFQYGNAGSVTVTLDPVGLVSIGMVGRPGGVASLDDNGAVPVSQGGTGEKTIQGTIDAFGIFLAISAAAAYDPEGSYAVGDYCTHGGKLHKCNTDILSGEAWNPAHWVETSVVAELLNKVSANSILGNTDLNTIRPYNRREMYIVWATCTNRPQNELFGYLTVSSSNGNYYCTQEFDGISGKKYSRYFEDSAWSEWEPFATATPPEDSDLPLSSGITKNYATYSIDQFGVVRVEIDLTKDGGFKNGEVIATLPVGVRPTKKLYRTITVTGSRPSQFVRAIVGIAIDTNGNISMLNTIDSNDVNVTNITGGFEFEVK